MTFATKLRQLMRAKEWSVSDLAKASGLTYPTIRSYLADPKSKGHRLPTLANAVRLANAFGVGVEAFSVCSDFEKPQ